MTFITKPNLKKRIIATLLDYTLFSLAAFIYIMLAGHDNDEGGKTVNGLLALVIPAAWFIYFVVVEALYGATLGHQGMDLKVLTLGRREIGLTEALKRHFLDPIDIFFYGIPAIIAIRNSDRHQRLGDMWAKTIVVDKKDKEQFLLNDVETVKQE
jgi:uncharacterized RDD family membrane protein YckC